MSLIDQIVALMPVYKAAVAESDKAQLDYIEEHLGFRPHLTEDRRMEVTPGQWAAIHKHAAESPDEPGRLHDVFAIPVDVVAECNRGIYAWDGEYDDKCELVKDHDGDHWDGMSWFNDDNEFTDDKHQGGAA